MAASLGLRYAEDTPFSDGLQAPLTAVQREVVGASELRREDLSLISPLAHPAGRLDASRTRAGLGEGGCVALIALAFGPPRLWGYLLDTAFVSFQDGYRQAGEVSPSTRLHQGMRAATDSVHTSVDALIDLCGADVALISLTLQGATLHVQASGPLHAYVARRRGLRRLGPRQLDAHAEQRPDGLLSSPGASYAEQLEPGDLVFAGSRRVCNDAALQRVGRMLERDRNADPQAVLNLLSVSAAEPGRGAATLAFRLPRF